MIWTIFLLIGVSLALGFGAWIMFAWGVGQRQFDDIEAPKYRIMDDDNDL